MITCFNLFSSVISASAVADGDRTSASTVADGDRTSASTVADGDRISASTVADGDTDGRSCLLFYTEPVRLRKNVDKRGICCQW